jgi:enoyl-CoA hydratase
MADAAEPETAGTETLVLIDAPRPMVRRLTLNRPQKRNALSNALRGALFAALEAADKDPAVRVTIIRAAGPSFCAGYDLGGGLFDDQPYHTAGGAGNWPRHVTDGCFRIWDLAKPVIAEVHGYCLAGGTELAAACDLVYVAEDARIGYPPVRAISPPDNQFFPWYVGFRRAMEMMLTGDSITGAQAAEFGFANQAVPADGLEAHVLGVAERVAKIPTDLQQINKRSVHRQMDIMGIRAGIRAGTEMQALATTTPTAQAHFAELRNSVTGALTKRDGEFGDYRTASANPGGPASR